MDLNESDQLKHLVSSAERLKKLAMTVLEKRRKSNGRRDTNIERLASKALTGAVKDQRASYQRAREQHRRAAALHNRLIDILDRKRLDEAFDAPLPVEVKTDTIWQHSAEFDVDEKRYYIEIIQCGSVHEILVNFYLIDPEDGHHESGITGNGNSIKVISTVVNYVRQVIARWESINTIYFQADTAEPSRVKLYRALAARAAKELDWVVGDEGRTKQYTLFTVKKPVD